jgi:hypothetical protein
MTGPWGCARRTYVLEKYQQLLHRHAPSFVRHVLEGFRKWRLNASEAADQLQISRSRLYALRTEYLKACANKTAHVWVPGGSGGDHTSAWPAPVLSLLKKRLGSSPPCPYSFVASEALRLHAFKLDRAQVRRWALENDFAHPVPPPRPHAPVRRWQRSQIGELWQLDASPHPWFPQLPLDFPMLNMLDDCSRLFVGSKLYDRELLLSYLDFLPAAFLAHGRPLQLYVDYHSIFFSQTPEALTPLGWALNSMTLVSVTPRHLKPKAKSSGNISSGKNGSHPILRANRSPIWKMPTAISTICVTTATAMKPIANWANPHSGPGTWQKTKIAPLSAQHLAAPVGRMFGASGPRSNSVPIAGCRSAHNVSASNTRQAPKSFFASTPAGTSRSWPPNPNQNKNLLACSPTVPNRPVLLC